MRKFIFGPALVISLLLNLGQSVRADTGGTGGAKKEWTFLIYLNGNNNLDQFGAFNINQMEKVGSTDRINVVVQWASLRNGKTQRMLVKRDSDSNNVTSPVLEDMGSVDMGDWHSLVDFVKWGHEKFPAEHYFVDVWNHGGGWHLQSGARALHPTDISWDDNTGHHISTEQLGTAMTEASQILGQKVDLFATDACLMAMAEVATQLANSVQIYAGSEEVEPGTGWAYDDLLNAWSKRGATSPRDLGALLVEHYFAAYQGGQYKKQEITYSAFDLSKTPVLVSAMRDLGARIAQSSADDLKKVMSAATSTQTYTNSDYADLGNFAQNLENAGIRSDIRGALSEYVIVNRASKKYERSQGVSVWLPTVKYQYNGYWGRYKDLELNQQTQWLTAIRAILGVK